MTESEDAWFKKGSLGALTNAFVESVDVPEYGVKKSPNTFFGIPRHTRPVSHANGAERCLSKMEVSRWRRAYVTADCTNDQAKNSITFSKKYVYQVGNREYRWPRGFGPKKSGKGQTELGPARPGLTCCSIFEKVLHVGTKAKLWISGLQAGPGLDFLAQTWGFRARLHS